MKRTIDLLCLVVLISISLTSCDTSSKLSPTPTPIEATDEPAIAEPTNTPNPLYTAEPTKASDWKIISTVEENIYALEGLWPPEYRLLDEANVYALRNLEIVSCTLADRYDDHAYVLVKGNFSGYDDFGRFVDRFIFTFKVNVTLDDWGGVDPDLISASLSVEKA